MQLTAAILAGGGAARFGGRDKSALVVHGRTILDRQVAELMQLTEHILLVGRASRDDRLLAVADLVPGCGPLGGLYTALTEARTDVVVVVACDMPFVSAALLGHLAALTATGVDAAVARSERGYHPLYAAYTRACLEPIARRLAERRLKMADFLTDVRLRVVDPEELDRFGDYRRLLANINTPDEYNAALEGHEL